MWLQYHDVGVSVNLEFWNLFHPKQIIVGKKIFYSQLNCYYNFSLFVWSWLVKNCADYA